MKKKIFEFIIDYLQKKLKKQAISDLCLRQISLDDIDFTTHRRKYNKDEKNEHSLEFIKNLFMSIKIYGKALPFISTNQRDGKNILMSSISHINILKRLGINYAYTFACAFTKSNEVTLLKELNK